MRRISIIFLFAFLLAATPSSVGRQARAGSSSGGEANGAISGRVSISGKAAASIPVVLYRGDFAPETAVETVVTTDSGEYSFSRLAAGYYVIQAYAPSLIPSTAGETRGRNRRIALSKGQHVVASLELSPGGVITGRITDGEGKPLIEEAVDIERVGSHGEKQYYDSQLPETLRTDDRGIYRVYGLEPGRYVVSLGLDSGALTAWGHPGAYYPKIYYPGVTDEKSAAPVEVSAGRETTGVDIVVDLSARRTFTASGTMIDPSTGRGVPLVAYRCTLVGADGQTRGSVSRREWVTDSLGHFEVQGLLPGHYAISAEPGSRSKYYHEPLRFDVPGKDVSDLIVNLKRGATLAGTVALVGEADGKTPAELSRLEVSASVAAQASMQLLSAPVAADGSFRLSGLRPGRASLNLSGGASGNLVLLRVERNGAPLPGEIEIQGGEQLTGFQLVATAPSGSIRGELRMVGGALPDDVSITVWYQRSGEVGWAGVVIDPSRRFAFDHLLAGEYKLIVGLSAHSPSLADRLKPIPKTEKIVQIQPGEESQVVLVLNLADTAFSSKL